LNSCWPIYMSYRWD